MLSRLRRVLLVDDFSNRSVVAVSRAESFARAGVEVTRFDYRQLARRIGLSRRDRAIVEQCRAIQAELAFFAKCNDVGSEVIKACNESARTVLWYMDPLNDNFSDSLRAKIRCCSVTCCASWLPYQEARTLSQSVHLVEQGFDPGVHHPVDAEPAHDVTFIGTLRGRRRAYHRATRFRHITGVYGADHSLAVARSRINLNFTMGPGEISVRFCKVLASRGFLLTQPWPRMEDHFAPGHDFAVFETVEDLRKQIAHYLEREDERRVIAAHGWRTIQAFTWDRFAQRVLAIVETGVDPGPGPPEPPGDQTRRA